MSIRTHMSRSQKHSYPSPATLDAIDEAFSAPAENESDPSKLVADESEMAERHLERKMIEKGFDGRGMVRVSNKAVPDHAYKLFLKTLGDDASHTHLKAALAVTDTDAARAFLADLFNPLKRRTSIETIAKQNGIGIPQLRDIWRHARLDQGFIALLNAYPVTMKHIARDARSTKESCKFCGGTGQITDEHAPPVPVARYAPSGPKTKNKEGDFDMRPALIACHSCRGRGWVRKAGDKDARSFIGEALGVTGKKPSLVSATTNISVNLESVISEIEQMKKPDAARGIYEGVALPVTD